MKSAAVAADMVQAIVSVIATLPGSGNLVNLANYAAGPALALSAVPAEIADLMEDDERWELSNWRQRSLRPLTNVGGALSCVVDALRGSLPNGRAEAAERPVSAWSTLAESDAFADGISSLANALNVTNGLVTLAATLSSGGDPLYLNVTGAVLSAAAASSDLWEAVRRDRSRSAARRALLWSSFLINFVSALLGGIAAGMLNDDDNTASVVLGLCSSLIGLAGSVWSELADFVDRPGAQAQRWNQFYLRSLHQSGSAHADLAAPRTSALAQAGQRPPPRPQTRSSAAIMSRGLSWLHRHHAALLSAWDEAFNAASRPDAMAPFAALPGQA